MQKLADRRRMTEWYSMECFGLQEAGQHGRIFQNDMDRIRLYTAVFSSGVTMERFCGSFML